jgi:uncharacterized protein
MLARLLGIALVVGWIVWFLRRARHKAAPTDVASSAKPTGPLEIVACVHCGVHLPRQEMLLGRNRALFCCEAHRAAQERL